MRLTRTAFLWSDFLAHLKWRRRRERDVLVGCGGWVYSGGCNAWVGFASFTNFIGSSSWWMRCHEWPWTSAKSGPGNGAGGSVFEYLLHDQVSTDAFPIKYSNSFVCFVSTQFMKSVVSDGSLSLTIWMEMKCWCFVSDVQRVKPYTVMLCVINSRLCGYWCQCPHYALLVYVLLQFTWLHSHVYGNVCVRSQKLSCVKSVTLDSTMFVKVLPCWGW